MNEDFSLSKEKISSMITLFFSVHIFQSKQGDNQPQLGLDSCFSKGEFEPFLKYLKYLMYRQREERDLHGVRKQDPKINIFDIHYSFEYLSFSLEKKKPFIEMGNCKVKNFHVKLLIPMLLISIC